MNHMMMMHSPPPYYNMGVPIYETPEQTRMRMKAGIIALISFFLVSTIFCIVFFCLVGPRMK